MRQIADWLRARADVKLAACHEISIALGRKGGKKRKLKQLEAVRALIVSAQNLFLLVHRIVAICLNLHCMMLYCLTRG